MNTIKLKMVLFCCMSFGFWVQGQFLCGLVSRNTGTTRPPMVLQRPSFSPRITNIIDRPNLRSVTNPSTDISIRVFYHIVTKSDGTRGYNPCDLKQITRKLNEFYNPHNIYIAYSGFDILKNPTYYNLMVNPTDYTNYHNLVQINKKPDAINFYIVNSVGSYAGLGTLRGTTLVVQKDYTDTHASAHELGHCLNLYHTHEAGRTCPDNNLLGTSSNCQNCSDLVCDTPADPGLSGVRGSLVNPSSCQYTGGNGYTPDTRNIMSYTTSSCATHFTRGQIARARKMIFDTNLLQAVTFFGRPSLSPPSFSSSSPSLSIKGPDTFCNVPGFSNYFLGNNCADTEWSVSPHFRVISRSNDRICVQATRSGYAYIEARSNDSSGIYTTEEGHITLTYKLRNDITENIYAPLYSETYTYEFLEDYVAFKRVDCKENCKKIFIKVSS